jgi:hypothetical protein
LDANRDDHLDRDGTTILRTFLDRTAEKELVIDLGAEPARWLLEMPVMPFACTRSFTERVELPCT